MYSPILLFVYNRLEHTKKTIDALLRNDQSDESEIIIHSDGPKDEEELSKIIELRSYLKSVKGFKKVTLIEQEKNLGLSKSIISGVNEILRSYDRVIVLEDDIITSPYFLRNLNIALDLYLDDERVINISGYTFPHKEELPYTFFSYFPAVWGWATWKRGWSLFEEDGALLLRRLQKKQLIQRFNFDNLLPFSKMLEDQIHGRNDSWAIRWFGSSVLNQKYTLLFNRSLSRNIGHDSSGIHCSNSTLFEVPLEKVKMHFEKTEINVRADVEMELRNYLIAILFEQHMNLHDVCRERLELIDRLSEEADRRLAVINQLTHELETLKKKINC